MLLLCGIDCEADTETIQRAFRAEYCLRRSDWLISKGLTAWIGPVAVHSPLRLSLTARDLSSVLRLLCNLMQHSYM